MRVLILNSILYTAESKALPKVKSIKDCMIYNFALGFAKLGCSVTLVAAHEYKPTCSEVYDFEVVFLKSNLKSIFPVNVLPLHISLISFLRDRKDSFDLVISSESFSFSSLFASFLVPRKLVIWHELFKHNNRFKKIPSKVWYNIIVPIFYRRVCIIPRSQIAQMFIQKYAKNVSEQYIEHGINMNKFPLSKEKRKQFVVVAQLIKRKRIDEIIIHFVALLKQHKNEGECYKLLIIGRGEEEEALKVLVHNNNIEDFVEFKGFLSHDQLSVILAQSQALLVDTIKDNNIVTIPESIVAGTPVLTNTIPSNSFYVKANDLGIVKDNWNENEMEQIIRDNKQYSSNCVVYRENLSDVSMARKMIDIFNQFKQCNN